MATTPLRRALLLLLLCACASTPKVRDPNADKHDVQGAIILNGERTTVHWSDGDSFNFTSGPHQGKGTRLQGYNTLEAYGPVHRWGSWSRQELYVIAKEASKVAASREWQCTTDGDEDAYHRVLVDCPELAYEMAKTGFGLAYAVKGHPPVRVLDAQHQAMRNKRGMWAKGVTRGVITSLHSMGEDGDGRRSSSSNRVVDTRTGEALLRSHKDRYDTCEEVCMETDGERSCMLYVPFAQRYRDQPPCLLAD